MACCAQRQRSTLWPAGPLPAAQEAGGAGPSHAAVGLASELVVGVPSDLPLVINPDDSQAAAAFSGVGECKVRWG